ncbi:MAG: hypothetical protein KDD66_04185 [Bdellovibrionales bacterium]|nr:hypothetical protein [Bdellovibrionales bacterium]
MFSGKKSTLICSSLVALTTLSGCLSRSISGGAGGRGLHQQQAVIYGGELSENDVLGLSSAALVSDEQIQNALDSAAKIQITKGAKIMLVQSGARVPDHSMIKSFESNYGVSVFSGIAENSSPQSSYAKALRLAAARSGSEKIVCYWGKVESASRELETKVVSWVPIVGQIVPDKAQRMRIQLKIAVIDVRTGSWDIYSSKTFDDLSVSAKISRESSDQGQIDELKSKAYKAAAEEFIQRYSV